MEKKYADFKTNSDNSKNSKKIHKKFNYGLAILKVILAFLVLVWHNFDYKSSKNKTIIFITKNRKHHVPSFFIMSFYFMAPHLFSLNFKILINRLFRLYIPYIIWPIIFYKLNGYLNRYYHKNFPDSNEELKMQLLTGKRFDFPLWFQCDLINLTILFFVIIFIFRKLSVYIFEIIIILVYAVEYSGYKYTNILKKYLWNDAWRITFLFNSIPHTISGLLLGFHKMIDIIQKHKIRTFVLSFLIYNIIADYNIFRNIKGSMYPGLNLNIQSICLVFIFSIFPSHYITNKYIQKLINIITSYTAGIFYIHVPIHKYLKDYSYNMRKRTFKGMIQEYLICYFICFIGMLIFGKTPLRHMFS